MAIRLSDDILELDGRPNTSGILSTAGAFILLLESNAIDKNVFFKELHTKLLELYFPGFRLDTVELKYYGAETTFEALFVSKILDIYTDLKIALFQIDELGADELTEHGLWQLKWGFENHWGSTLY